MDMSRIQEVACTAAFFIEGAHDAGYDKMLAAVADNGAVETIAELSSYAILSTQLVEALEDQGWYEYPGLYDYEVSVAFGAWFARYVIDNCDTPPTDQAAKKLLEMALDFFTQYDPIPSPARHEMHRLANDWGRT